MSTSLQKSLNQIVSLPIWKAENSHGSMAILEMGEPHLVSTRFRGIKGKQGDPKGVRRILAVGEYSLHILDCNWEVFFGPKRVGGVKSRIDVRSGLSRLQGQFIKKTLLSATGKEFVLSGDEGVSIHITPYEGIPEQWVLYKNVGRQWALFVNSKGQLVKEDIHSPIASRLKWKRR